MIDPGDGVCRGRGHSEMAPPPERGGWVVRLFLSAFIVVLVGSACAPPVEQDGPISVACDAPSPIDTTTVHVVLAEPARVNGGRILVRVDSLASLEGPIFNADEGFLIQAFATVGPGYGCASIVPVGGIVRGPGRTLERAWIHVKTDLPVHVVVRAEGGAVIAEAYATPGELVEPVTWGPAS
jgi:hypothetical protein